MDAEIAASGANPQEGARWVNTRGGAAAEIKHIDVRKANAHFGTRRRRELLELPAPYVPVRIPAGRTNGYYHRFGKRVVDVAFSAFVLVVSSWLLALLAMAIKLDSRGPVLFRQKRVGRHGEIFECLKFRTMSHDPSAQFVQVSSKHDPRITRVGRFLRRTNLDEMPQFLNVVRGDMSVVGPRPHVPELGHMFQDHVPGYATRTVIRPGISGLAQISGCRGETRSVWDMSKRVRFDIFYVRNVSFLLDLAIVFGTIWALVRGDEKAY